MRLRLLPLLCATLVTLAVPRVQAADAPGVRLAETRPIDTTLGDPTLPTAAEVWVEMIRSARTRIDLGHFYLSRKPGEALDPVLDELGRAAARGVKVRLLLDTGMHRTYPQPADSLAGLPNLQVRLVDYRAAAGGVQHAKFMVVDDRVAWVGSQNLDWRALSHIHELGASVTVPAAVTAFADAFAHDWALAGGETPPVASSLRWPVAFTQDGERGELWASASPPKQHPASLAVDREVLLERVNRARRTLCAQFLSYGVGSRGFVDSTLHRALIAAAGRGVKVRLIASDWTIGGRGEADLRGLAAVPGIEVRVSRVPEWSGGYIPFARVEHCKFMVADGEWLWLGTSNWEPSYFQSSRNLALTMHHRGLATRVQRVFDTSWNAPSAIALRAGVTLEARVHGEKPPEGVPLYGE